MMLRPILRQCALFGAALLLALCSGGCSARPDVELQAPDLSVDTLNPALPFLAAALPENPAAQSFRLKYRIVPDPQMPRQSLENSLVYNRAAKTLAVHRSAPFYDLYAGVSDAIIARVAAQKGGVRMLLRFGCTRTFPPDD